MQVIFDELSLELSEDILSPPWSNTLNVSLSERVRQVAGEAVAQFLDSAVDLQNSQTKVFVTANQFNIENIEEGNLKALVNLKRVNQIPFPNEFFAAANYQIADGGVFVGCVETIGQRHQRLMQKFPVVLAQIYYFFDFIFKRLFPKLGLTRRLYLAITADRNRVMSLTETLGRLVYCGFKVISYTEIDGLTYFVVQKEAMPARGKESSYGAVFKMRRIGEKGRPITVYKFRTMHPYAEYLQPFVYEQNDIEEGGKFKHDFRITSWGRFMRKWWLDELPMIINWLKRDLKLIGFRPLSEHYLSLYSADLRKKRKNYKPGLIPPYYYDLPKTLDEIMESEEAYLAAYDQAPLKTDIRYLFGVLRNIFLKSARSG